MEYTNYICSYIAAAPLAQKQLLLTKGDNNLQDDIGLYQGLQWLEKKHIIGKVDGYVNPSSLIFHYLSVT